MASKTTQSANDIVNYMARGVAPSWAGATTLYLSLHTGAIPLGSDITANEISYTGYARYALARNASGEFDVAASGSTANNILVLFGVATAGSFPISVTHLGISAAASGAGTCIASGAISGGGVTINLNSNPTILVGNLVWQEQ
jgi:hypothetical protein